MSTNSKLNPKILAIKKKLQWRLGLAKKRYLPLAQKPIDNSNRNAEWSVPTETLSRLDLAQDIRNEDFLIKIQKSNQDVWNLEKRHNSTSQQGDLFGRQINENRRLYAELLQYLSIALGHSSIHITEHYVAMSKSARSSGISDVSKRLEYVRKFYPYISGLRPSEAIEEDL